MELCIASLFSGSKGNALFIRYGKTSILIDAGMSARAVDKALAAVNSAAAELDAIFVTHEHIDHIKALKVLSKRVPVKIHLTKPTADAILSAQQISFADTLVAHEAVFSVSLGALTVESFPTPHDSAQSVGFRISVQTPDGIRTIGVATDLGLRGRYGPHSPFGFGICHSRGKPRRKYAHVRFLSIPAQTAYSVLARPSFKRSLRPFSL